MTDEVRLLAELCGTSVHATEALLTILQEHKIKYLTRIRRKACGGWLRAGLSPADEVRAPACDSEQSLLRVYSKSTPSRSESPVSARRLTRASGTEP